MKTFIKKYGPILLLLAVVLPIAVSAQTTQIPGQPPIVSSVDSILNIIRNILRWLQIFFFTIAAIFIIIAAFNYLTAQGSEEKVGTAKKQIWYAVIAIIVALVATSIGPIVDSFLRTNQ